MLKATIKQFFNHLGLDICRLEKSPRYSLLGLRSLPIGIVIDVGANRGQFARYIREIYPRAQILCFEPLPDAFAALAAWARTLPGEPVKVFQLALGDAAGTVSMYHHTGHDASSSMLATTALATSLYPQLQAQAQVEVELTTLDRALAFLDRQSPPEILIKLDVQGYESRVIRGGRAIFAHARACIVEVNLDGLYEQQSGFSEIMRLLSESGYRYAGNLEQMYGDDGHVIYFDAVFLRPDSH